MILKIDPRPHFCGERRGTMFVFEHWFTYTTPLNFTRFKGIIKALIRWNVCAAHVNTFSSNLVTFFRINNKMFVCPVPKISHRYAKSLVKPGFTRVQAWFNQPDFSGFQTRLTRPYRMCKKPG